MDAEENGVNWESLQPKLIEAIVSGFFHNLAEMHDRDYIKAGYSAITPCDFVANKADCCDKPRTFKHVNKDEVNDPAKQLT